MNENGTSILLLKYLVKIYWKNNGIVYSCLLSSLPWFPFPCQALLVPGNFPPVHRNNNTPNQDYTPYITFLKLVTIVVKNLRMAMLIKL